MGVCFLYGNSGVISKLRLQIYGGLTAPVNPKEHTIWIKTGTPITKWLLTGKANAWTNDLGTVIIVYESSNTYNFSNAEIFVYNGKLNGIYGQWWMRLLHCYQSNGSGVKSVDAYVYVNGSWVQFSSAWNGELFDNGNQYEVVTGGWVGNGISSTSVGTNLSLIVANTSPYLTTQNAIDLSGYSKLHMIADGNAGQYSYFGISSNVPSNARPDYIASATFSGGENVLDISAINSGHISIGATASWGVTINISKVWLT